MIEINWDPIPHLGPLPINWYGLTFLIGLIVGWRKRRPSEGLNFWSKFRDTVRYAAFLATYSGTFVAVDEGIAAVFGKRR